MRRDIRNGRIKLALMVIVGTAIVGGLVYLSIVK